MALSASPSTRRIVLIDDDPKVLGELHALLSEEGYDIVGTAVNGELGIATIEACQPTAVVMDIRMPVVNGLEATAIINERWPSLPVLLLSAFDDGMIAQAVANLDIAGYYLKGESAIKLLRKIDEIHGL